MAMEFNLKAFAYDVTCLKKGNVDRADTWNGSKLCIMFN